LNIVNQL